MSLLSYPTIAVLLLLGASPYGLTLPGYASPSHATPTLVTLELWNPTLHSSNVTSLTLFPPDSLLTIRVNVTNAERLTGFDITLNYNITAGPNVLQAITTGSELSGSLFDPNNPPTGCGILIAKAEIDFPPGRIRFAGVVLGGCSVPGTGTLVTLTFVVTGIGVTSIDIVQTNTLGKAVSFLVGPSPDFKLIPFRPVNAYFRNKAGIPPVALFNYSPLNPIQGDRVYFSAAGSFDPDNSTLPGKGIRKYLWTFGDNSFPTEGALVDHIFIFYLNFSLAGSFSVKLVVWDHSDLPSENIVVVSVAAGFTEVQTQNWSGYAVASLPGAVFDVKGSWIVPAIQGPCPPSQDVHSSFWVGIDGLNSPTVEQIGTESACVNGTPTYFAWYQFYPRPAIVIRIMTVHPGDVISAQVSYSTNTTKFTVSIADLTAGQYFTRSARLRSALRSSAEWIVEAPTSRAGILPLAPFGKIYFGQATTNVAGTCFATIGSQTGPIGSFGSAVNVITMVGSLGVKANPSPLSGNQTSFFVNYVSAL